MKLNPFFTHTQKFTQNGSKMDLIKMDQMFCKSKNNKMLKDKKHRSKPSWPWGLGLNKTFLAMTPKAQTARSKLVIWTS